MKNKFIFLDIDGTLYDSIVKIPDSAKAAIRIARKNGHKVMICTGRPKEEVEDFIHEIGFDGYIYSSGALVEVHDEVLFYSCLDTTKIHEMQKILHQLSIGYNLEGRFRSYLSGHAFTFFESLFMNDHKLNSEMARHQMSSMNMYRVDQMQEEDYEQIVKISLFAESERAFTLLKPHIPDYFHFIQHHYYEQNYLNGELSNKNCSKASGMDIILKYFHADISQSIALGDSMNDISMIQHANIGICMGNGADALKEISDYITLPIQEDGLYHAFKHFSLI